MQHNYPHYLRLFCSGQGFTGFLFGVCHQILAGSRSQPLDSVGIETLLQALSVDLSAGSYITTFCEQSGNKVQRLSAVHCVRSYSP